jgi:hypothetical protein
MGIKEALIKASFQIGNISLVEDTPAAARNSPCATLFRRPAVVRFRGLARVFTCATGRARGCLRPDLPRSAHPVGQAKQGVELMPVLGQAVIAHFPVPK